MSVTYLVKLMCGCEWRYPSECLPPYWYWKKAENVATLHCPTHGDERPISLSDRKESQ
jgi:hypothetical protein